MIWIFLHNWLKHIGEIKGAFWSLGRYLAQPHHIVGVKNQNHNISHRNQIHNFAQKSGLYTEYFEIQLISSKNILQVWVSIFVCCFFDTLWNFRFQGWFVLLDFVYFLSDISARWVLFFLPALEGWDRNWEGELPFHLSDKLLCLAELRLRNNL